MWLLALVIIGGIAAGGIVLTAKESQRPGPSAPGASPPDDTKRNKKKLTGENEKLIGLDDPSFRYQTDQGANTGMTTVKFDTTTYGDRAVLQLRNETGSTRTIGDAAILGKPVIQMSGRSGYLWEYSDYDNIDKNGEKYVEVSNRFIISPAQCEDIGDYCWKKLAPHKMYNVTIPGCHPEYEPGDVWTLSGTYIINGVTVENINAEVEIQSVSVHRACLTPGETVLTCVLYDGAWSKTNSTRSRIVGAGKPQWMQNRSNVLVVASKDYAGQADYYCDGVNDEAQIQEAINTVEPLGGGIVELTLGEYDIAGLITLKNNTTLQGTGLGTVLNITDMGIIPSGTYAGRGATIWGSSISARVCDFVIDGLYENHGALQYKYGICLESCDAIIAQIKFIDLLSSEAAGVYYAIFCTGSAYQDISYCDISLVYGEAASIAIYGADRAHGNTIKSVVSAGIAYGIAYSKRCALNRATSVGGPTSAKYFNAYADAGTANACADTAAGGYNS